MKGLFIYLHWQLGNFKWVLFCCCGINKVFPRPPKAAMIHLWFVLPDMVCSSDCTNSNHCSSCFRMMNCYGGDENEGDKSKKWIKQGLHYEKLWSCAIPCSVDNNELIYKLKKSCRVNFLTLLCLEVTREWFFHHPLQFHVEQWYCNVLVALVLLVGLAYERFKYMTIRAKYIIRYNINMLFK